MLKWIHSNLNKLFNLFKILKYWSCIKRWGNLFYQTIFLCEFQSFTVILFLILVKTRKVWKCKNFSEILVEEKHSRIKHCIPIGYKKRLVEALIFIKKQHLYTYCNFHLLENTVIMQGKYVLHVYSRFQLFCAWMCTYMFANAALQLCAVFLAYWNVTQ